MATYVQPEGTSTQGYYQDVPLTPAMLSAGEIQDRFDLVQFPMRGVINPALQGTAGTAPVAVAAFS